MGLHALTQVTRSYASLKPIEARGIGRMSPDLLLLVGSGDETIRSLHVTSCHMTTSKYLVGAIQSLSSNASTYFDYVDMKTSLKIETIYGSTRNFAHAKTLN